MTSNTKNEPETREARSIWPNTTAQRTGKTKEQRKK
jgi:hypothetical protein